MCVCVCVRVCVCDTGHGGAQPLAGGYGQDANSYGGCSGYGGPQDSYGPPGGG